LVFLPIAAAVGFLVTSASPLETPAEAGKLTSAIVKTLAPEASSISQADAKKIFSAPKGPTLDSIKNQSLTLLFLSLRPKESPKAKEEFRYLAKGLPKPSQIAEEITASRMLRLFRPKYVTFLHADRITKCTVKASGDKAQGTVAFKAPKLYEGKVHYKAKKTAKGWRIVEFSLPAHGVKTQLQASGLWKIVK
jgi:hypothetical protein